MILNYPGARPARRGIVIVLVGVSLTLLVGIVAITIDGGLVQENRRRVQNAADSAAMAAGNMIFAKYPKIVSSGTADPEGAAAAAAQKSASYNGFANGGASSVTVNIPPASGPFKGKISYAEVIITYQQPRYFGSIWGSAPTPVTARAAARGFWGGTGNGVIVLDPSAKSALDASGTGSVAVTGGASMIVNSNHSEAGRATGGGSLTASQFRVTGGVTGTFNGPVTTGSPPIQDPLAYLPAPSVPPDGIMTQRNIGMGNKEYTFSPGRYSNLPSFQTGDVLIFKQASANGNGGIYYLDGGGFNSQGATIQMDTSTSGGLMFYNNPASSAQSQGVSITGNSSGSVTLSALTSGPYAGILMWQNRTSTVSMSIAGNGSFDLTGTFYTANANLQITGNGTATIGSQYISRTLSLSGNGAITINYTDDGTARKREVRLVE